MSAIVEQQVRDNELKIVVRYLYWKIERQLEGEYIRDHMGYIEQNEKTNQNVNTVAQEKS